MKRVGLVAAVAALVALSTVGGEPTHAQLAADSQDALRRQVERRFEVLAIQNGLVLRPKSDVRGVRLIQIADNAIAIDGTAVTGGELRDRLGPEVAEHDRCDACKHRHRDCHYHEGTPFVGGKSSTYAAGQGICRNCIEDAEAKHHR